MAQERSGTDSVLVTGGNDSLFAVPLEDGRVVYSNSEEAIESFLREFLPSDALRLAGVWRDLDWKTTIRALRKIRHASKPTPPIDLNFTS